MRAATKRKRARRTSSVTVDLASPPGPAPAAARKRARLPQKPVPPAAYGRVADIAVCRRVYVDRPVKLDVLKRAAVDTFPDGAPADRGSHDLHRGGAPSL